MAQPIKGFRNPSPDDYEFAVGLLNQGETLDAQLRYWRERLAGVRLAMLGFSADYAARLWRVFALDLLFSARKLSAAEAVRLGLVNQVFPQETFLQEVMAYAKTLAQTVSPRSTAVIKAQIWKAMFQDFNAALALADAEMQKSFASADFKEGVAHYLQKRAPAFTGH